MNGFEITNYSTKSYVMLTTDNIVQVNVGANITRNEITVTLLGITVDNKLLFELHLNKICKKVSQKFHALARISTHIHKRNLERL